MISIERINNLKINYLNSFKKKVETTVLTFFFICYQIINEYH